MSGHYWGQAGGQLASGIARGLLGRRQRQDVEGEQLFNLLLGMGGASEEQEPFYREIIGKRFPGFQIPAVKRAPKPFMDRPASEVYSPEDLAGLPPGISARDALALKPRLREKYDPDLAAERERGEAERGEAATERRRQRAREALSLHMQINPNASLPPNLVAELQSVGLKVPTREEFKSFTAGGAGAPSEAIRKQAGQRIQYGEPSTVLDRPEAAPEYVTVFDKRTGATRQIQLPPGSKQFVVTESDPPEYRGFLTVVDWNGNIRGQTPLPPGQKGQIVQLSRPPAAGGTAAGLTGAQLAANRRAAVEQANREAADLDSTGGAPWKTPAEREQWVARRTAFLENYYSGRPQPPSPTATTGLSPDDKKGLDAYPSWEAAVQADPELANAPAPWQAAARAYIAGKRGKGKPASAPRATTPPGQVPGIVGGQAGLRGAVLRAARRGEPFPEAQVRGVNPRVIAELRALYKKNLRKRG